MNKVKKQRSSIKLSEHDRLLLVLDELSFNEVAAYFNLSGTQLQLVFTNNMTSSHYSEQYAQADADMRDALRYEKPLPEWISSLLAKDELDKI